MWVCLDPSPSNLRGSGGLTGKPERPAQAGPWRGNLTDLL